MTYAHPPIAILGAGSWGTALALHLSRLGQPVHLWTHDEKAAKLMQTGRVNTSYLPHLSFPDSLQVFTDLSDAVNKVQDILIAVPSSAFSEVLLQIKPLLTPSTRIVWATKGLDIKTGQFLHEIVLEKIGKDHLYAVLSGPSFAREVAEGLPTAIVAASTHPPFTHDLMTRFNSKVFRVYSSDDIIGVEIGGAVKNVLAIAAGISDGMQFGANARSALITRGLAELIRLGIALGAKQETLIGLSGLGDLVLTCTDNQSRNRRFGMALGSCKTAYEAEREIGQVIEGKRNVELIANLAQKHHIEMPITEAVRYVLRGDLTPLQAMELLLSREPKAE